LAFLSRSRRKKPVKRPSLRDSGIECASSLFDSGEEVGESPGGWSTPGTERYSLIAGSANGVSRAGEDTWMEGEVGLLLSSLLAGWW